MEEDAKRDLGILPEKEFSPEDIRGKFIEGTTHLKRRKESGRKPAHLGVILAIIALLIFCGIICRPAVGLSKSYKLKQSKLNLL